MPVTTENDYDLLPYRSMPFAQTQPAHLATIATLFGLQPPPAERARVLELGCASGGNLLPLAVRFPEARFTGIDLSSRHIDDGQQVIRQLGLTNIDLRQGDLAAISLEDQEFDYVICHGVFSWVPHHVQDAILRICSENLVANGVAYISYNVLPGWHTRKIVRDICAHHAGKEGSPQYRVARARWVLDQVAKLSSNTSTFGQILRDEAKLTAPLPDSYILGEFLADNNDPCYFSEFADRASAHGLSFLSETNISASIPESLGPDQARLIREIAGDSGAALEQYMDFFSGRPFRRSLWIKSGQASTIQRALSSEHIAKLHVLSSLKQDPEASDENNSAFTRNALTLTTNDPIVTKAMITLASDYPNSRATAALLESLSVAQDSPEGKRLLKALLKAALANHVQISTEPMQAGLASSQFPSVNQLARWQASCGQAWASSRQHQAVSLHPVMSLLLPDMDGSLNQEALSVRLDEALLQGRLQIDGMSAERLSDAGQRRAIATNLLRQMLDYLQEHSLLEPQ